MNEILSKITYLLLWKLSNSQRAPRQTSCISHPRSICTWFTYRINAFSTKGRRKISILTYFSAWSLCDPPEWAKLTSCWRTAEAMVPTILEYNTVCLNNRESRSRCARAAAFVIVAGYDSQISRITIYIYTYIYMPDVHRLSRIKLLAWKLITKNN